MPEIKYEVVDKIGIVSEGNNGWNKELNLISWNDREPVYDIRTWSPDHEKMDNDSFGQMARIIDSYIC